MLSQSLLTPISAQQDGAPVAPGFVVFLLYTGPSFLYSLPLSLGSDRFIDGLSTLTMPGYCFVSSVCLCCAFLPLVHFAPFTLIFLSTCASHSVVTFHHVPTLYVLGNDFRNSKKVEKRMYYKMNL